MRSKVLEKDFVLALATLALFYCLSLGQSLGASAYCVSLNVCNDGDTESPVAVLGVRLVKFFPSVFDLCGMSMLHTAVQ